MSSTLKVDILQDSGGNNLVTSNGSGVITSAGFGKIGQVVSTTKTDTFTASLANNASTDITGLSVNITPTSTSSKILIFYSVQGVSGQSNRYVNFGLVLKRGSSEIVLGDTAGNRVRVTNFITIRANANDPNTGASISYNYLDSPSSTSEQTYTIALKNLSSATTSYQINRTNGDANEANYRPRATSTITAMEVLP